MENGNYAGMLQQQIPSGSLDQYGKGLGQLGAGLQSAVEDPLAKLLREYRDAKYRFDNACQLAAKAIQEREQATNALETLSQTVEKAVAAGRYDPTQPQPTQTAIDPAKFCKAY